MANTHEASPAENVSAPQAGERYASLAELSDAEYLATSHEFGVQYKELLTGTAVESELAAQVKAAAEPYVTSLEGLSEAEIATTMVQGYRDTYNQLLTAHGAQPEFPELTEDDLRHVQAVGKTSIGVPVLYTNGNRALFGHDAASFASSQLLMEAGLPPLVVVGNTLGDKEQAALHESSHAAWAVMQGADMIPGEVTDTPHELGSRSAFDTARDEAAAMQVAGQGKIIHPSVIKRLEQDGFDEAHIERYRQTTHGYADAMRDVQGIEQADSVLGFMQAQTWEDFFEHVERMTQIAEAAPHSAPVVARVAVHAVVDGPSGWGAA
jgi:hypothetical protein